MEEEKTSPAIIKVVGVGGGGMNAVTRMANSSMKGVEFLIMNTDEQVLLKSPIETKIQIGSKVTRGMGAGGDPELGSKAAQEDKERIMAVLKGADMVFVTAGMGGGTGTGAAPVVAAIAKEMKCLVVGVVTMPFTIEGRRREQIAKNGLDQLRANVDTLITIRNDSIFQVVDKTTPIDMAFRVVDDILLNGVRGISDIINHPGIINVDFADVRTIMKDTGDAVLGVGEGIGETRVSDAVEQAIHNALLEDTSISGAKSLLINVSGGNDLSIHDWHEVSQIITSQVDPEANIIIGLNEDNGLKEMIRVTVIATGFNSPAIKSNPRSFPTTTNSVKDEIRTKSFLDTPVDFEEERLERVSFREEREREFPSQREIPSRSLRPHKTGVGYVNYGDDYEIPAYLRRKAE